MIDESTMSRNWTAHSNSSVRAARRLMALSASELVIQRTPKLAACPATALANSAYSSRRRQECVLDRDRCVLVPDVQAKLMLAPRVGFALPPRRRLAGLCHPGRDPSVTVMTLLDTRTTTTPRADARAYIARRLAWGPALGLHLAPAAAAFGTALLLAPAMRALHLPPGFALTVAFALVLTPLELGVLLTFAHRATGRWSLRAIPAVVAYRRPIGRWWWAVPPLFGVALVLAVAWQPIGDAIGRSLAGVLPGWLLPGFDGTAGGSPSPP